MTKHTSKPENRTSVLDVESVPPERDPTFAEFLCALGYRPNDRVPLLGTRPEDERGRTITAIHRVADFRDDDWTPPPDVNVWFGVNPVSASVRRGVGCDADVVRVRVWTCDLDVKDGCLASLDECYAVVSVLTGWLGVPPAAVVESGHGLQPYWRVKSTKSASARIRSASRDDTAEATEWTRDLHLWGGLVRLAVNEVRPGAKADSVFHLNRKMRAPGGVNHKEPARPVRVRTALTGSEGAGGPRGAIQSEALGLSRGCVRRVAKARKVHTPPNLKTVVAPVPTSRTEAWKWVENQPGANEGAATMSRAMFRHLDYDGLIREFSYGTENESSAHNLMRGRVWSAVRLSTEGHSGVYWALEFVRRAYLATMELRRAGRLDGERRTLDAATRDFDRALTGAVASVRERANDPLPQRDRHGNVVVPITAARSLRNSTQKKATK
ncbi:hypothetical protein [Rhodococcus sp. NPDC058521]|uniref:hypothetical protein n=1 Tax=Rhodococcus sp. NPDC058521 TaxID=3346536 RepID=UPI00366718C1